MKIVVTGAAGFIGRHLVDALRRRPEFAVVELRRDNFSSELKVALDGAAAVFHLAGVNRPQDPAEFESGNCGLTARICAVLETRGAKPLVVLASSIQAEQDNPYGRSKLAAEEALAAWAARSGAPALVFRLRNVFGKWCRPNYNSVTATFCHNIARGLPITISDPASVLTLVYIDDLIAALLGCLAERPEGGCKRREVTPVYTTTLGHMAALIESFRASRRTLELSTFDDVFTRLLYVTYLSYLEGRDFSYGLQQRTDRRGTLAEFMKSASFGQIFVSRTIPGVTRGNHYHHSKTEKFLVVEGEAVVRFRAIGGSEVIEHRVNGREYRVVDIPPGYTHSIENVGADDLVTLFWASEVFDPERPDTIMLQVLPPT